MSENILPTSRILVVDDDVLLRQVLRDQFTAHQVMHLAEAGTLAQARDMLSQTQPDLIILDVQLPDGNGFSFCAELRASGFDRPIIMLTGQDSEQDIVTGLDGGANDYIAKPMRIGELLARMNAQLRQFKSSDDARFPIQGLDFIPANKTISNAEGRMISLTEKETLILKKLFRTRPDTVSKDVLLSEIWGYGAGMTTHTIETHIYRLRQKLRRLDSDHIIETTGDGYSLCSEDIAH